VPAAKVARPPRSAAETRAILAKLETQHPGADTELHYTTPYELLVATILSAQCTDDRVNQVTPALFKRYSDASALAKATTAELEPQIKSTGFFRAKSKSLLGMATAVCAKHAGEVPATMEDLTGLPGVGRKTANVVLGHALGVPGLPVDRHVLRVSNRIGIAKGDDAEVVEQQLCAALPKEMWTKASDTLILHGRRICKPKPLCDKCVVRADCVYYQKVVAPATKGGTPRAAKSSVEKSTRPAAAAGRRATSRRTPQGTRPLAARGRAASPRRTPQDINPVAARGRAARRKK
jgi:endonuclease-3